MSAPEPRHAALPRPLRALVALRHALLPRSLRAEHGAEMDAALAERYSTASGSPSATWRLLRHEFRDLISTAVNERRRSTHRPSVVHDAHQPQRPSHRRRLYHPHHPRLPPGRFAMLDNLKQDLRHALRMLRDSPLVTLVSVLTLALGIGAVVAVYSVVDAVLLEPLPYDDSDELVVVWTNFGPDLPQNWISGPEYLEIKRFNRTLEQLAVIAQDSALLTGVDEPEQVPAAVVSGELFSVLAVEAARGRVLEPADDAPEAELVAVITDGFWRRRFGADPGIVGRVVTLDGQPFTIVGVLPAGFGLHHPNVADPNGVDLWLPLQPTYATTYDQLSRGSHFLLGLGRLRDGVGLEQLAADLDAVAVAISEANAGTYDFEGWGLTGYSLHEDLVEGQRAGLAVLLGAVAFVLLIACVNVANLQLSRATVREREIAVRAALGAGRWRLLGQLMTESVVLAAVGAIAGLALAFGLLRAIAVWMPAGMPRADAIGLDLGVLAFAVAVSMATAALFGVAPALFASRVDTTVSLKDGGRGSTGGAGGRARGLLVVAEVALALVLAVGAGLMMRSFQEILRADPGFELDEIFTMSVSLPPRYDADARGVFWSDLLEQVRAVPGVQRAGAVSHLPLSGAYSSGTTLVEHSELVDRDDMQFPFIEADRRTITPGYFETMGVRLLRGRLFTEQDNHDGARVAIVDDQFARRFWGDDDPIGQRVATEFDFDSETMTVYPTWREVVGVVRQPRHYDLTTVGREQVYVPLRQSGAARMYLTLRTAGDAAAVSAVRGLVRALDRDVPISDERSMDERAWQSVSQPRFASMLFASFAGAALLLAAIGIYGVMSFTVGQRTGEIGVRMALGADRGGVQRLVLGGGLRLAGWGIAIGFIAALALARLLEGMLYGIGPADPLTFATVAAALGVVALLASWVPALRATRVQPVEALRDR